jgi:Na+/phosphate symporter
MNLGISKEQYETMVKNIEEIKSVIKKPPDTNSPQGVKSIEKVKYFFYGLTKSLIDMGNRIIEEKELRRPRNNADVFISLAEHDIVMSSLVPGLKKAVFSMRRMSGCSYDELLAIIGQSIDAIHKCLDSYTVYFDFRLQSPKK